MLHMWGVWFVAHSGVVVLCANHHVAGDFAEYVLYLQMMCWQEMQGGSLVQRLEPCRAKGWLETLLSRTQGSGNSNEGARSTRFDQGLDWGV